MTKEKLRFKFQHKFYRFKKIIWEGIDWLFPPHCAGCGKISHRFCPNCIEVTPKPKPGRCALCGAKETRNQVHICSRKENIDEALVWGLHAGPLQTALHHFKYKHDLGLAERFGDLMVEQFDRSDLEVDIIVPIPLSRKRQRARGYNQAGLLAESIAGKTGLVYLPKAVKRIRETRSQVGLNFDQRRENVSGAFRADHKQVGGKRILLVDDVLTTGATLNACAQALKDAGATSVVTLTLARAP